MAIPPTCISGNAGLVGLRRPLLWLSAQWRWPKEVRRSLASYRDRGAGDRGE
jgi:hypothetical protein